MPDSGEDTLKLVGSFTCPACSSATTVTVNKRGLYTCMCPDCRGYFHSHRYIVRMLYKGINQATKLIGITVSELEDEFDTIILQGIPLKSHKAPFSFEVMREKLKKR